MRKQTLGFEMFEMLKVKTIERSLEEFRAVGGRRVVQVRKVADG